MNTPRFSPANPPDPALGSSNGTSLSDDLAPPRERIAREPGTLESKHWLVILASSLGSVFEWYDFYIYGALAATFGVLFFPPGNETAGFLSSLALFGVGFAVRPLGALVFGRIGDLVGRKYTFLVTILVMGLATALVGVLPTFQQFETWGLSGWTAPALLLVLRMLQGLALGGEYGGAVVYVAEHSPAHRRGRDTSWIQTTVTFGFFLSLLIIGPLRAYMSPVDFASYGWRIPFLVSTVLVGVSVYIRLKLQESPVYQEMKAHGKDSKAPISESFGNWANLKLVLIALFGSTAGMTVIWYTGQFYAFYFLSTVLKVSPNTTSLLVGTALALGMPFYYVWGWVSDHTARKYLICGGCLVGALLLMPIFKAITRNANPALVHAVESAPVTLYTTEHHGNVFSLVGAAAGDALKQIVGLPRAKTPTNDARTYLNGKGIPFSTGPARGDAPLVTTVGDQTLTGFDKAAYDAAFAKTEYAKITVPVSADGKVRAADPAAINKPVVIVLLTLLVILATLVYSPLASFLVELFPTRIRYTSLSVPYHIASGWFGGFQPLISSAIVLFTGGIYNGLWYPVTIALMTFVVGGLFAPDTRGRDIRQ